MCAHVFVPMCTCVSVCACARASVISGLSSLFRIYTNPLNIIHRYTARIVFIFVMWDYLSIYFYVGNVARREVFDLHIELKLLIFT